MQDFEQVLHNQILLVSLLACFTAQGLKALIELIRDGKVSLRYLVCREECLALTRRWWEPWLLG